MAFKEYLRFGLPPINERSGIYKDGQLIGYEKGVSCWECIYINGEYRIVLPRYIAPEVLNNLRTCYNSDLNDCPARILYVITGDEVGKGADGEPLLRNVNIIKELGRGYFGYREILEELKYNK